MTAKNGRCVSYTPTVGLKIMLESHIRSREGLEVETLLDCDMVEDLNIVQL